MYYRDARNSSIGFLPATLRLTKSGNDLTLSWPLQPDASVLQFNADVNAAGWTPLPVPVSLGSGQQSVSLPATNAHLLFRLQYP